MRSTGSAEPFVCVRPRGKFSTKPTIAATNLASDLLCLSGRAEATMLKHLGKSLLCFGAALAPLAAAPAKAQSDDNALNSAIDAFGERDGIEQIGLYDENQVRGFDLARAGSNRIDG